MVLRTNPPSGIVAPPRPGVPSWAATFRGACRRHFAEAGVLVGTMIFVLAAACCGLLLIRRG